MSRRITRRKFIKRSALTGALILTAPGLARTYGANSKPVSAIIGTGGRGGSHVGSAMADQCVAACDVDPNGRGRGGINKIKKKFADAKVYTDYRELFDAHKDLDVVYVGTPDHNHFLPSIRAIQQGAGVYCEKPLTYDIWEARMLAEAARMKKVPTQMGNQGHANRGNRLIVEWIRDGVIGTVKEVHTWTNRPVWPQGYGQLPKKVRAEGIDWEAWIGPAPYRERYDHMHPFQWRGWLDYGTGAVGDMGCHTFDNVWWSMDPKAPLSAEPVKVVGANDLTYPKQMIVKWTFGPSDWRPGFTAYWYTGGLRPDVPQEIKDDPARKEKQLPGTGSLYIGTKGKLLVSGDYGGSPRLIPEAAMQEFAKSRQGKQSPHAIPPSPGHKAEFHMAVRGEKPWDFPKSNFMYGGPMVEALLFANIAARVGEKLEWDPKELKITNHADANKYVRREPREGWTIHS